MNIKMQRSCCTLQVAIPIDDFYGSHLKLMFKHRASAEGMCYVHSGVNVLFTTVNLDLCKICKMLCKVKIIPTKMGRDRNPI